MNERIVVVDNYDSFTWNLVQLLYGNGREVVVRRNDEVDAETLEDLAPSHVVISPGPGRPEDAGATCAIVDRWAERVPILGVCLGHQAIAHVNGGRVERAPRVVHGGVEPDAGGPLPFLARLRARPAVPARGRRVHERGGDHGSARGRHPRGGRTIPSRIDPDRRRTPAHRELPEGDTVSPLRGIRGGLAVELLDRLVQLDRVTRALLVAMASRNGLDPGRMVAIWFTQTSDLTAAHAPASARALGWTGVPLLGAQEAPVADQMPRVVRALMIADLDDHERRARHVYLGVTRALRDDLSDGDLG